MMSYTLFNDKPAPGIRITSLIFLLLLTGMHCRVVKKETSFRFHPEEGGIRLTHADESLFFYQRDTKALSGRYPRANYIHPLYGLGGEVLTEDFPEDHLHHRGIFWAWHQFYVRHEKVGDPWECRDIEWEVEKMDTRVFADSAKLSLVVYWKGKLPGNVPEEPVRLIREETDIVYHYRSPELRMMDFRISLTALYDGTAIGGSENEKGYSGFSVRCKLPDDLRFYSEAGQVEPKVTAIDAGGWIDIRGTFSPGRSEQTAITMMCNPDSPEPFHGWILRERGSMQNAAFPGREPIPIPEGEKLNMRYRLVLHPEGMPLSGIREIYEEFIHH